LIDDLEDGDRKLALAGGGDWYTLGDGTGQGSGAVDEIPGTRGGSAFTWGYHAVGSGHSDWGSLVGFNLGTPHFDASEFTGVRFWLRAKATTKIIVQFPDQYSDEAAGLCQSAGTCNKHFVAELTAHSEWSHYTVPFSSLKPISWAGDIGRDQVDAKTLYSIVFFFEKGLEYDVWVDDVSFYKE
jgi:hypothetical protein